MHSKIISKYWDGTAFWKFFGHLINVHCFSGICKYYAFNTGWPNHMTTVDVKLPHLAWRHKFVRSLSLENGWVTLIQMGPTAEKAYGWNLSEGTVSRPEPHYSTPSFLVFSCHHMDLQPTIYHADTGKHAHTYLVPLTEYKPCPPQSPVQDNIKWRACFWMKGTFLSWLSTK